jgi:hypothetical protein
MLRAYLEKIMGLASGSDGNLTMKMVRDLLDGFVGEGITDNRAVVFKTHYPERRGIGQFPLKKAILLARNPLDTIVSYFNLVATGSHSFSVEDSDYKKL